MGASAPVRDPAPGPARLERWGKREIVVLDDVEDADGMTLPDWFYWGA
jgi:hypothetical protein